jgi:hypothetical protein
MSQHGARRMNKQNKHHKPYPTEVHFLSKIDYID